MVALRQTLNPQDDLKIIMDRRSSRPSTEAPPEPADRPSIERRRHPHVDVALNVDGFAIVPASANDRPQTHVRTAPSPVATALRDDAEVEDTERREDDADPPRWTETPARAASPHGPRSAYPEGPRDAPVRGETLDETDVDDANSQGHQAEPPGHSDRPPRAPNRHTRNPSIQRLYPEEPRDESLDDAGLDHSNGGADDAESLSRLGNRPPRFPDPRIPSRRTTRPRIPKSRHWDERFDDHDEPRHGRSVLIWVVVALVAAIGVLALLGMGQTIEAFKVRIEPPRPSFATRPGADPPLADQAGEPLTAPPDQASGQRTDKPPSLTPSPGADLARKAEPEPEEGTRAPVPPSELPARRRPQPVLEHRRQTGSPANTQSPTSGGRPEAASRTFPGLPRVELIRSPAPRSSGSGGTYVVRISNTTGRPLLVVEASLVAHMGDGSALSIPLEPGPEPGEYRATIPHDRPLRDLRVRIMTSDSRFEVPVER